MKGQKRGYGKLLWVLIAAILLLALLLGAVMLLLVGDRAPDRGEGLAYEANVVAGDIPGKSKEERQRELNSTVGEGTLAMSINVTPSGKGTRGGRSVNWLIEDPGNQGKLTRVEIYRGDTGEKIYKTGTIKPDGYVENASPDVNLLIGEYDCTARSCTYCLEAEGYIRQAAARIRLVIYE